MITTAKNKAKRQNLDVEVRADKGKDSSKKEGLEILKHGKREATKKRTKEQRVKIDLLTLLSCHVFLVFVFICCVFFIRVFLSLILTQKEYYEREMEKRGIRTNPLGRDRFYNRYWWFRHDGRIFFESSDSKEWGYYSSKEEVLILLS